MRRNSTVSPFLRLPAEIRNNIYGFVFGYHLLKILYIRHERRIKTINGERHRVHIGGGYTNRLAGPERVYDEQQKVEGLHLGMLRVCRQVYDEAALLPYALNRVAFENAWAKRQCLNTPQKRALARFSVPMSAAKRNEIRRLLVM